VTFGRKALKCQREYENEREIENVKENEKQDRLNWQTNNRRKRKTDIKRGEKEINK